MKRKILNKPIEWLTRGCTEIPLFTITFNYKKYTRDGEEGSCLCKFHPYFSEDQELKKILQSAIDHIRNNYDMNKFAEF